MGGQARWVQRWSLGVGLAGLFLVLCVLAVFTVLSQQRVARSARRANTANVLSALYKGRRDTRSESRAVAGAGVSAIP